MFEEILIAGRGNVDRVNQPIWFTAVYNNLQNTKKFQPYITVKKVHSRPKKATLSLFWSAPRIAVSGSCLWQSPAPKAGDSRTSCHSAHAQSQVRQI